MNGCVWKVNLYFCFGVRSAWRITETMPFNFQVCLGAGGAGISLCVLLLPSAGVDGTVDGAVDGALAVGMPTTGGGNSGTGGKSGELTPLSIPGGEVRGVGADDASGDDDPGCFAR